ncbi:MAG: acetyl-CoA carboxylase biotin carboxyl carrier protein subunit [Chloroflexota bacterium]|nr:MAG: acetyl-CoA carboxylase biotin carboxyl carrier protein subunit [Chloroflexota bacterium]
MKYITTLDGKEYLIEITDEHHVSVNGRLLEVDFVSVNGQPVYSMIIDGKSYESYVYETEEGWQVLTRGRQYNLTVEDEREKRLRAAAGGGVAESGEYHLKAPMPGLIVAIPVNEGDPVKKGQTLVILESMKMQNELKSPKDGTVGRIRVKQGETVEQRQALLSVQ